MLKFFVSLVFALIVSTALAEDGDSIQKSFKDAEIVSDVIPVAPAELLKVTYDSGVSANLGNELTPTQVKNQPTLEWESKADEYYTLVMTDPDAPSRANPKAREWHHWVVGNIRGNDLTSADVLSEYIGSGPPPDTGLHRYVFLVYKQTGHIEFTETRLTNRSGDGRAKFSSRDFTKKHNFNAPIAGNFYQAQYDDYVPTLYKQLGA